MHASAPAALASTHVLDGALYMMYMPVCMLAALALSFAQSRLGAHGVLLYSLYTMYDELDEAMLPRQQMHLPHAQLMHRAAAAHNAPTDTQHVMPYAP